MVEIHTKITCTHCEESYYALRASDIPLEKTISASTNCPHCGAVNKYAYRFSSNEKIKRWKFWQKHFITDHFSKNDGIMTPEYFPRRCKCGKEILLKQERIL